MPAGKRSGKFHGMIISPQNYETMRAWLARTAPEIFPNISVETDPIRFLDQMFEKSPAKARKGLAMAIGDIVGMTGSFSKEQVAALDLLLSQDGLPSVREISLRYSKVVQRIVARGKIKNEEEFYAVRNAAEFEGELQDTLWKIIAAYEVGRAS